DHRNLSRRGSHFPWELVTPDEVLAAELGGIHPQLVREVVDRALGREDGLRLPGAAVGGRRRLAGERRAHPAGVVPEPVGARPAPGDPATHPAGCGAIGSTTTP